MTGHGGVASAGTRVGRPLLWTALVLFLVVTSLLAASAFLSSDGSGSRFSWWPGQTGRNLVSAAAGTDSQKLDRALDRMMQAKYLTELDPAQATDELDQAYEDVADVKDSMDHAPAVSVSSEAPDWFGGAASLASLIAAVLGLLTAAVGLWVTRGSRNRQEKRTDSGGT